MKYQEILPIALCIFLFLVNTAWLYYTWGLIPRRLSYAVVFSGLFALSGAGALTMRLFGLI